MAGVGWRNKVYTGDDVVAIPAAKTAGAVTIAGEVLYPFEQSGWGPARVVYWTTDHTKVTANLYFYTYVSFDEGTSWDQVHTDTINAGANAVATYVIPMAPRVRIDFVSDGTGALVATHGVSISVEFQENDPEAKRVFFGDSMGDSFKVDGDSAGTAVTGTAVEVNSPGKLTLFMTADDLSDIDDTFTWVIQTSSDNSHWFTGDSIAAGYAPANGSGVAECLAHETTATENLLKYVRLSVTGDTVADVTTAHGIKYYFLAQE